ncbi:MAG TPA: cytochrome c biogenesis protein CcdA, partial [Dietzia sp.]|nr:cytochrome c biogenesis protein CcdA [Dietzia sp.]
IGGQGRRRLRGRSFTVLGREFHTTSVITGVLITIVGVVFWATNGLIDMPSLIPTSVSAWVQGRSSILANGWVDLGVILAVAAIALLIWWRSARQKPVSAEPGEHETR